MPRRPNTTAPSTAGGPDRGWFGKLALTGLAVLCLALAAGSGGANAAGRVTVLKTAYFAPTDTYFRVVRDHAIDPQGPLWHEARALAAQMTYEGRPGRLAKVDDPALFAWVGSTFPLSTIKWADGATWIGLRYWCNARLLSWVDMTIHPHTEFSPWAVPWHLDGKPACTGRNATYLGVFHQGKLNGWQAVAPQKRYPHFMVEFPPTTPAKQPATAQ